MKQVSLLLLILCCLGCRVLKHEADRHIEKVAEQEIERVVTKIVADGVQKAWPFVSTGLLSLLSAGLGLKIVARKRNGKTAGG